MSFRYLVAAMVALLAAIGSSCHAAPIDPGPFTREMAARIMQAAPQAKVEIAGPLTLKLNGGTQNETQVNLDRIADFCAHNDAQDCETSKARFAAGTASMIVTDYKVTRDNLRAVVRSPDYASGMQEAVKAKKLPVFPLAEGLVVMIAADFPSTTQLVDMEALAPVSRDVKAALEIARTNVLTKLQKVPTAAELQKQGVILMAGRDYESSLLLADGWGDLARSTDGALFVAVPGDNEVVVGLASDDQTLQRLRVLVAEDYRSAERPVSPYIYRWETKGWAVAR